MIIYVIIRPRCYRRTVFNKNFIWTKRREKDVWCSLNQLMVHPQPPVDRILTRFDNTRVEMELEMLREKNTELKIFSGIKWTTVQCRLFSFADPLENFIKEDFVQPIRMDRLESAYSIHTAQIIAFILQQHCRNKSNIAAMLTQYNCNIFVLYERNTLLFRVAFIKSE